MKVTKITDRHIMFTVPENADYNMNLGLILGKKHNFIIDTGMGASNVNAILEYLAGDPKPIVVVNTHAHADHIMGNWVLEDSLIVSHTLCRDIMDKQWDRDIKEIIHKNREYYDDEIHKCLPNLVFEGSLQFPEDGISIFHTPGHTEDCISVYDAVDKVLYIGDNFGVSDGVAHLWAKGLHASQCLIETYKQYDFDICIPSHSEPQTREVITLLEIAVAKAWREQEDGSN